MEGLRFRPTEAELLKMLRQFTEGEYTGGLVARRDLYGEKEPWEICTGTGTATDDNTWYFFTELKRKPAKNGAGKRFLRSVGKGTWHGTSKVEKIFHDDRKQILLGVKRNFTYWGDDEERKGEFVMNEFSLPENTVTPDRKDFVICRLKRKKAAPSPPADDISIHDELFSGVEVVVEALQQEEERSLAATTTSEAAALEWANWKRSFGYVHPFDFLGESEVPFEHNNNNVKNTRPQDDSNNNNIIIIIAPAPPSIPATANGDDNNMSSFASPLGDDFFRGLEAYEHGNRSSNNVGDNEGRRRRRRVNQWVSNTLENYDDDDDDIMTIPDDDDVLIDWDMLLRSINYVP